MSWAFLEATAARLQRGGHCQGCRSACGPLLEVSRWEKRLTEAESWQPHRGVEMLGAVPGAPLKVPWEGLPGVGA